MIGVILANTGSPSSPDPDDIERYLSEFLMDERIRQLPKPVWKWLVTRKILPKRKYSSAQRYRFIWQPDGSPLLSQSRALAKKVQDLFDADCASDGAHANDATVVVRSAMSYGSPSIAEVLTEEPKLASEIAEAVGISVSQASALAKKVDGVTVTDVKVKGKGVRKAYSIA